MPRGQKSRHRHNARAAEEENRNNRKIQASEASKTLLAASVVPCTLEDNLSGPKEDLSTLEKTSTPPEEASSTAQGQKSSVVRSNFQGTKKSLLMSVLALIFIMGNSAKEALVWKVLGKLGMQPGQQHSIFGDPKKIVTEEFVRRRYLIYKPVPGSSPIEYEFFWGPRAHVESSKLKVMHFVARVRNRCSKDWPCNYDWDSDDDAEVEAILHSGARVHSAP
ncbi:melanoma-associated antigen H1 [Otolemur garnettii]|uniref:MAGE family member H1 n=1 Tax=Otolemur garnettii TaxID=30611 RepID=H0X294_OTOGA|nr:melanoma-associated antigen H1 [Otolemur garnettii]